MDIKNVRKNDIKKIVTIHLNSFKDFFLSSLGKFFLETYYTILHKDKGTTFIGCYIDDELGGFCSIANISKGFNQRIIKSNILAFLLVGIRLLLKKPGSIIRLIKNLDKNSSPNDKGDYSEILSIAVSEYNQGKGIGKKLLLHAEKILTKNKFYKLSLTTDFYNNENALNFYKKNGYKVFSDFYSYPNRKMYRLIKNL